MSGWFDKHFSRKELKTTLLAAAIIAIVGLVWSKVGEGIVAQWLGRVFDTLWSWTVAAWTFCVNAVMAAITYVSGPVELSRWVLFVLLLFAVVPLIKFLVRRMRAGSFRDAIEETYQYLAEMTLGDFIRTTFDMKYAREHRRRWKESQLSDERGGENDEQAERELDEGKVAEVELTLETRVLAAAAILRNDDIPTFAAIDIAEPLGVERLLVERAIDELEQVGMIESAGYTTKGEEYVLTRDGRDYVLDSDLLNHPDIQ